MTMMIHIGGCWWLEGLTRGLVVISPRFKSQNWRFIPCTPCQHQGHEVKEAINLIQTNFNITLRLLIIVIFVFAVLCIVGALKSSLKAKGYPT